MSDGLRLYQRGDVWWTTVPDPKGGNRRVRMSTGCMDKEAAYLVAIDMERAAAIARMLRKDSTGRLRRTVMKMLDPDDDRGLVYFIRSTGTGLTKIGFTTNLSARLSVIQNGNPGGVHVVTTLQGNRVVERRWHRRFADKRVRGEWFDLSHDDLDEIKGHSQGTVHNARIDKHKENNSLGCNDNAD